MVRHMLFKGLWRLTNNISSSARRAVCGGAGWVCALVTTLTASNVMILTQFNVLPPYCVGFERGLLLPPKIVPSHETTHRADRMGLPLIGAGANFSLLRWRVRRSLQ